MTITITRGSNKPRLTFMSATAQCIFNGASPLIDNPTGWAMSSSPSLPLTWMGGVLGRLMPKGSPMIATEEPLRTKHPLYEPRQDRVFVNPVK